MIKILDSLRRLPENLSIDALNQPARDAIRACSFVLLVGAYFFTQLGEEEASGLIIVVAVVCFIFLYCDIRKYRFDVNLSANVLVAVSYFALLIAFLWLGGNEHPQIVGVASSWFKKFGFALIVLSVAAAIVEEIAFRRFLQVQLQRLMSANWAIFVSAILFMFAHGFFSFNLFFAGVALGILATHLGSIHAGILIHATTNFFGVASTCLDRTVNEHGLSNAIALGGSSALAELVAMALLFLFTVGRALYRRWR